MMPAVSRSRRLAWAAAVLSAVTALVATVPDAAHASALPVNYDFTTGLAATAAFPQTPPPGANDWNCKPSAEHPYPVILVHGTFGNMNDNWQAASPILANHGYCVFAFNYGGLLPDSPLQATGDITASAGQLAAFTDQVLAATGAAQVDIVGHSQGGMMPRYYINFLGGAAKVHRLVGIASSNYGLPWVGLVTLANAFGARDLLNAGLDTACVACDQQSTGSAFLAHLNAQPTMPGVEYTDIESADDELITPYTNAFLPAAPNVTNVTVQDQCSLDLSDHLEIASDPVAMADMLNALDPAHPVPVPCVAVLPAAGPVGPVPAF
jgi:hypothetical protein